MSTTESAAMAAPVIAAPVTVALHGAVGPFDATQEEWSEYAERLVHYFTANDINSAAKRRAILLNAVGATTYRLLKTLASPLQVTDLTFEQLVTRAKSHFNPKPSPIVKRYEFNTRRQDEGETVSTFVAGLRKIAEYCEYGVVLSDMLRDRVVCGIRDKSVQRRLLWETELTFDKALEIALAAETADKDSKRLTDCDQDSTPGQTQIRGKITGTDTTPVYKLNSGEKRYPPARPGDANKSSAREQECYRCGGRHHPSRCTFLEYECHFCKRKGHLAKMCRKKVANSQQLKQANVVTNTSNTNDAHTTEEEYSLFHVSSRSTKPLQTTVSVNGKHIVMKIDTGASVSLVNEETYKQLCEGAEYHSELQKPNITLQTYTGESIEMVGSAKVQVEHNGQMLVLPLIVTKGNGPNLLGRDWLQPLKLDWKTIFRMNTTRTLEGVLEQNSEVFKDGLGTLKGVTAKIYVDKDAQPRFHKPRTVPFAIRPKVEDELQRLQELGVIRPIKFADWAAPIVPVLKGNGRVRICGDYKITVNRAAKLDKYPIPRIDELFASLAGGKSFSKLDLSHAYLQVPLDKKSQEYVVINTHRGLFQYSRLPFGVSSAPAIFQRVMENLLQGISGICVYIDDILITGSTEQEHLENLSKVLNRLATAGMRLQKEKCEFLLPSVSYLGHVISAQGLHTSESKVEAVIKAPAPRNVAELRSFLGMVNYYGKFLPDLATTLSPLYVLLRQSTEWKWGSQQRKAFQEVKNMLKSGRVLVHFDDQLPLVLGGVTYDHLLLPHMAWELFSLI